MNSTTNAIGNQGQTSDRALESFDDNWDDDLEQSAKLAKGKQSRTVRHQKNFKTINVGSSNNRVNGKGDIEDIWD